MIRPAQGAGLGQRRVAVVVVRQVDGQQRIDPAARRSPSPRRPAAPGVTGHSRRAGHERGDRHGRLGQQPAARRAAVAPQRPPPQPGQEHRSVQDRAEEAQVGRVALGVVVAGEGAVVLQVGDPVGVTALQQHQPAARTAPSRSAARSRPSARWTTSWVTVTTATKMPNTTSGVSHHQPSQATSAKTADAEKRPGQREPRCAAASSQQVRAEFGQGGQLRARLARRPGAAQRIPRRRSGCPARRRPCPGRARWSRRPARSPGTADVVRDGALVGVAQRLPHAADRPARPAREPLVACAACRPAGPPPARPGAGRPAGRSAISRSPISFLRRCVLGVGRPSQAASSVCVEIITARWPAGALSRVAGRARPRRTCCCRRRAARRSPASAGGG